MSSSIRSTATRIQGAVRGLAKAIPGLLLTAGLAACGDTSIGSSFLNLAPKPAQPDPAVAAKYAATPTCPTAEIRFGTESSSIYAGKQGDDTALKYQINVQRVARDCDEVGDRIVARVGAAGLVIGGPKGTAGKVDVPVRIAAVNGDKVLLSELKIVSVQVDAPDFNGNWSLVDQVSIPAVGSADTIIYVGIDDKSKTAKPAEDAKPRVHRPRPAAPAADPNDPYPQMKPNIPQ
jgi:hypothetical protein